jgi:hypothetical protein
MAGPVSANMSATFGNQTMYANYKALLFLCPLCAQTLPVSQRLRGKAWCITCK